MVSKNKQYYFGKMLLADGSVKLGVFNTANDAYINPL
jgi:hypothetical protein